MSYRLELDLSVSPSGYRLIGPQGQIDGVVHLSELLHSQPWGDGELHICFGGSWSADMVEIVSVAHNKIVQSEILDLGLETMHSVSILNFNSKELVFEFLEAPDSAALRWRVSRKALHCFRVSLIGNLKLQLWVAYRKIIAGLRWE